MTGRVLFFNVRKGYGFLKADNTEEEFFVHFSQILGDEKFRALDTNDRVSYEVETGPKGPRAVRVEVLPRECGE